MTTLAQSEKQFILTFNHKTDETPTVRYGASPDHLFVMARRVVAQYPNATWYIVRRSDGVCIAQSKAPTAETVQQEPEQASTALVLPGCVTNLMLRSKSETLSDGTVGFKFEGKVKSRLDLHAFCVIAEERVWGMLSATFTGSGEGFDWKLVQQFNKDGGTSQVEFEMHDYSKRNTNDLEQRIARLVMRNYCATPAKIAKLVMAEIAR